MNEAAAADYEIALDVFEGPLDLLLHLVKKHELSILDIPISFVTEKYLEYLELMTALNLDVAGEYLLMAATLAYIKSRELLPAPETTDEEEGDEEELDPRQELIRRLLQYQKYREAADSLGGRPVMGRNVWTRGAPREEAIAQDVESEQLAPLKEFPVIKLIEAFDRVLGRAKVKLTHEVSVDRLSVSECINQMTDRLEREGSFSFSSCFRFLAEEQSIEQIRHDAVVTFLSILEMAKLGMVAINQPEQCGEIEEDIIISKAVEYVRGDVDDDIASTIASAMDEEYR